MSSKKFKLLYNTGDINDFINFMNTEYNTKKQFVLLDKKTSTFFSKDITSKGKCYLVANSQNQNISDLYPYHEMEIEFHMQMTNFIRSLRKKQRKEFSILLELMNNLYINTELKNKITTLLKVPIIEKDLRRVYPEGTRSISMNVPKPNSIMLKHHSYVSILECISIFFCKFNQFCIILTRMY